MSSSSTGTMMAMGDPCRGTPLPTDQHYVPAGMCARLVAENVGSLRQITFAPDGDLFGVTSGGSIRLLHDADGNGTFEASEITEFGKTGGNGNNCHVDAAGGHLYAGTPNGVKRFPYTPGSTTGGAGEDVVVGQPGGGNHPKHTVHVYDGYLYVHSGSSGNASDPMSPAYDTDRSLLRRFDLSTFTPGTPFQWSSGEVFSSGLRNMVGFTRNAAGQMFGVVNGLDDIHYQGSDVHQDNPGEQVVGLGMGKSFGYPFCFTAQRVVVNGQVIPAGTQLLNQDFNSGHDDAWCAANSTKPATFVQAHSAPLDISFFDTQPSGVLPEKWRGGAFIAFHGSWDRNAATGYKVVWMPFDAAGKAPMPTSDTTTTTFPYETVFGRGNAAAPLDGPWSWNDGNTGENVRPVGVAVSPIDGALYISSDSSGMLYRVGMGMIK
jgi:glucose/arabinose dehydrogenase